MNSTAIYFPLVVVFLATTQGMELNAGDYTIIVLLATLSSIATTPIPSASLVITIMIANSVGVPITGMYAVVVAVSLASFPLATSRSPVTSSRLRTFTSPLFHITGEVSPADALCALVRLVR